MDYRFVLLTPTAYRNSDYATEDKDSLVDEVASAFKNLLDFDVTYCCPTVKNEPNTNDFRALDQWLRECEFVVVIATEQRKEAFEKFLDHLIQYQSLRPFSSNRFLFLLVGNALPKPPQDIFINEVIQFHLDVPQRERRRWLKPICYFLKFPWKPDRKFQSNCIIDADSTDVPVGEKPFTDAQLESFLRKSGADPKLSSFTEVEETNWNEEGHCATTSSCQGNSVPVKDKWDDATVRQEISSEQTTEEPSGEKKSIFPISFKPSPVLGRVGNDNHTDDDVKYLYKFTIFTPKACSKNYTSNENVEKFCRDLYTITHAYGMPCRLVRGSEEAVFKNFILFQKEYLINSEYAVVVLSQDTLDCMHQFLARLVVFLTMKREWCNRFLLVCFGNVTFPPELNHNFVSNPLIVFPSENWINSPEPWKVLFSLVHVKWVPLQNAQKSESSSAKQSIKPNQSENSVEGTEQKPKETLEENKLLSVLSSVASNEVTNDDEDNQTPLTTAQSDSADLTKNPSNQDDEVDANENVKAPELVDNSKDEKDAFFKIPKMFKKSKKPKEEKNADSLKNLAGSSAGIMSAAMLKPLSTSKPGKGTTKVRGIKNSVKEEINEVEEEVVSKFEPVESTSMPMENGVNGLDEKQMEDNLSIEEKVSKKDTSKNYAAKHSKMVEMGKPPVSNEMTRNNAPLPMEGIENSPLETSDIKNDNQLNETTNENLNNSQEAVEKLTDQRKDELALKEKWLPEKHVPGIEYLSDKIAEHVNEELASQTSIDIQENLIIQTDPLKTLEETNIEKQLEKSNNLQDRDENSKSTDSHSFINQHQSEDAIPDLINSNGPTIIPNEQLTNTTHLQTMGNFQSDVLGVDLREPVDQKTSDIINSDADKNAAPFTEPQDNTKESNKNFNSNPYHGTWEQTAVNLKEDSSTLQKVNDNISMEDILESPGQKSLPDLSVFSKPNIDNEGLENLNNDLKDVSNFNGVRMQTEDSQEPPDTNLSISVLNVDVVLDNSNILDEGLEDRNRSNFVEKVEKIEAHISLQENEYEKADSQLDKEHEVRDDQFNEQNVTQENQIQAIKESQPGDVESYEEGEQLIPKIFSDIVEQHPSSKVFEDPVVEELPANEKPYFEAIEHLQTNIAGVYVNQFDNQNEYVDHEEETKQDCIPPILQWVNSSGQDVDASVKEVINIVPNGVEKQEETLQKTDNVIISIPRDVVATKPQVEEYSIDVEQENGDQKLIQTVESSIPEQHDNLVDIKEHTETTVPIEDLHLKEIQVIVPEITENKSQGNGVLKQESDKTNFSEVENMKNDPQESEISEMNDYGLEISVKINETSADDRNSKEQYEKVENKLSSISALDFNVSTRETPIKKSTNTGSDKEGLHDPDDLKADKYEENRNGIDTILSNSGKENENSRCSENIYDKNTEVQQNRTDSLSTHETENISVDENKVITLIDNDDSLLTLQSSIDTFPELQTSHNSFLDVTPIEGDAEASSRYRTSKGLFWFLELLGWSSNTKVSDENKVYTPFEPPEDVATACVVQQFHLASPGRDNCVIELGDPDTLREAFSDCSSQGSSSEANHLEKVSGTSYYERITNFTRSYWRLRKTSSHISLEKDELEEARTTYPIWAMTMDFILSRDPARQFLPNERYFLESDYMITAHLDEELPEEESYQLGISFHSTKLPSRENRSLFHRFFYPFEFIFSTNKFVEETSKESTEMDASPEEWIRPTTLNLDAVDASSMQLRQGSLPIRRHIISVCLLVGCTLLSPYYELLVQSLFHRITLFLTTEVEYVVFSGPYFGNFPPSSTSPTGNVLVPVDASYKPEVDSLASVSYISPSLYGRTATYPLKFIVQKSEPFIK